MVLDDKGTSPADPGCRDASTASHPRSVDEETSPAQAGDRGIMPSKFPGHQGTDLRDFSKETKNDGPWSPGRLHGRSNRTKKRHELTRIIPKEDVPIFNRFYILESLEEDKTLNRRSLETYKDIERACKGEPESCNVMRNGTILVKAKDGNQSKMIEKIKTIAGTRVQVAPHKKLNSSQGTILASRLDEYSEEEIAEHLSDKGVTEVIKIPKRPNARYRGTRYILTFNRMQPPETIRVGMERLQVRLYVPRPRRCFRCQGFGHVGKHCRSQVGTCANCATEAHVEPEETCRRPPTCRNCGGDHPASDRNCPKYKMEQEIITIVTKDKISFQEARTITKARYPDNVHSYAEMARRRRQNNNRYTETEKLPSRISRQDDNITMTPPRAGTSTESQKEKSTEPPAAEENIRDKRCFSSPETNSENKVTKFSRKEQSKRDTEEEHCTMLNPTKPQLEKMETDTSAKCTKQKPTHPDPPKEQRTMSLIHDFPMPSGNYTTEKRTRRNTESTTVTKNDKPSKQTETRPTNKSSLTKIPTVKLTNRNEKTTNRDPRLNKE